MKRSIFTMTLLFAMSVQAQQNPKLVTGSTINVDGTLHERLATDQELETIKAEIKKQKQETILNKEKSKGFQELSKSVGQLSATTEDYLLEKKAAQAQIAEYNEKVRCMQDDYPGKECDKYLSKRKQ